MVAVTRSMTAVISLVNVGWDGFLLEADRKNTDRRIILPVSLIVQPHKNLDGSLFFREEKPFQLVHILNHGIQIGFGYFRVSCQVIYSPFQAYIQK